MCYNAVVMKNRIFKTMHRPTVARCSYARTGRLVIDGAGVVGRRDS